MTSPNLEEHTYFDEALLDQWLTTPMGQATACWVQTKLDDLVSNLFGFHAVQLGASSLALLRNNRMPKRSIVTQHEAPTGESEFNWVKSVAEGIPFENNSLDLIVLPFTINCTPNPHHLLREVERVLIAEGHVIVIGFNPHSLWGLKNKSSRQPFTPFANAQQISVHRLKDWLYLLSFEPERGVFGMYDLPTQNPNTLARWHWMNLAGNRWWPSAGGVYIVEAVKRVSGMHLVGQPWKTGKKLALQPQVTSPQLERKTHD